MFWGGLWSTVPRLPLPPCSPLSLISDLGAGPGDVPVPSQLLTRILRLLLVSVLPLWGSFPLACLSQTLVYPKPVLCPASRFLPKASPVSLHCPALPSVPAAAALNCAWGKDSVLKITRSLSQNAEMGLYWVLPAGAALGSVPWWAPSLQDPRDPLPKPQQASQGRGHALGWLPPSFNTKWGRGEGNVAGVGMQLPSGQGERDGDEVAAGLGPLLTPLREGPSEPGRDGGRANSVWRMGSRRWCQPPAPLSIPHISLWHRWEMSLPRGDAARGAGSYRSTRWYPSGPCAAQRRGSAGAVDPCPQPLATALPLPTATTKHVSSRRFLIICGAVTRGEGGLGWG